MIKIEMVEIPSSQYQKINSFAIGKYPVTQEQYKAVMGVNPSYFQGNPQNPVESVSWDEAEAFCIKLSGMTGKSYRLPTEEEWEYACRAGTTTHYYFGNDANQLRDYAWYYDNSEATTHPVGQKLPNAWGLYDMHGNVWEWCEGAVNRGGSWGSNASLCCSAFGKNNSLRSHRNDNSGFRVVEIIKPILSAEEMWETGLPLPYKNMIVSEVVEYLDNLQTKEEKEKLLIAIFCSGFQTGLELEKQASYLL